MATMNQVQNGLTKYIDTEILPSMQGWQKWVFGAGVSIALGNLPATINRWKGHEVVKMLGVIDENGNIDMPKVYQGIKRQSAKGPVSFDVPGMGTLTLHDADVDKIYNMIMGG